MGAGQAPFVVTFSVATAALTATSLLACGLEHGSPLYGDAGTNSSGSSGDPTPTPYPTTQPEPEPFPDPQPRPPPEPASCPPEEPPVQSPCFLSSSTSCSYVDGCDSRPPDVFSEKTYACVSGAWTITSKPYVARCPLAPPTTGDSCALCATEYPASCTYADPSGVCPPTLAACDPFTRTWQIKASSCNPPAVDAGAGP